MLDGIVVLIILIVTVMAAKKGFIRSAYGLVASIIALMVAFFVYPIMNAFLKITPLYEYVREWNLRNIGSLEVVMGLQAQADIIKKTTEWLPSFIGDTIVKNNNPEVYKLMGANNISEYISVYTTGFCISALALILTWVAVRVILGITMNTLDIIAKLPVISTANKYAGAGLGLAKGLLLIWIIGLIIPFLVTLPQFEKFLVALDASHLTKWLYQNNLLLEYLNKLFL